MTILLADQNLKFCRRVCDRGYIIEKGRVVHEDSMNANWGDEAVIQKYLVISTFDNYHAKVSFSIKLGAWAGRADTFSFWQHIVR